MKDAGTAIADILAAFGSLGIKPPKRRGQPRGAKKPTARRTIGKKKVAKKRRKFKTTAEGQAGKFV